MTRPSATPETRTTRSVWVDPRLVIGIVLVIASIIGVYAIVAANDHRVPVYVARIPLSVGQTIRAEDLTIASVAFDGDTTRYLKPGKPLGDDLVVRRAVGPGEFLPAAAVGPASDMRFTSVVLELSSPRPASVIDGAVVDVWSSAANEEGRFTAPGVIVGGASVVRVISGGSLVSPQGSESIEVLIPTSKVAVVLEAVANGDALSVVPAVSAHTAGH